MYLNRTFFKNIYYLLFITVLLIRALNNLFLNNVELQFSVSPNMILTNLHVHLDLINHHGYCHAIEIFIVVVATAGSI